MAYATLGVVYGNLSQTNQQLQNLSKAFDLKDRASEREKLYISAHYYSEVTREVDKAWRSMSSGSRPIPATRFHGTTWRSVTKSTGQPEKALANASEAMRLDPKDRFAYANLADAYQRLGRYDEAKHCD